MLSKTMVRMGGKTAGGNMDMRIQPEAHSRWTRHVYTCSCVVFN